MIHLRIAVLGVVLGSLWMAPAKAMSIDCNTATAAAEKAVCADLYLSGLDARLARVYNGLLARLPASVQRRLHHRHHVFEALRNRCESDEACIARRYLSRFDDMCRVAKQHKLSCAALE
jgi:uncharacterized protein